MDEFDEQRSLEDWTDDRSGAYGDGVSDDHWGGASGQAASSVSSESPVTGAKPAWRRALGHRRTLRVVGVGLVTASLVGLGFGLGWTVAMRQTPPVIETRTVEVPVPQYASGDAVSMPDVRGLAQPEAQAVLADAGISASVVTVATQEFAGSAGIVVSQTPVFGTENPPTVELLVSAPAVVPAVVGQPEREATDTLMALGTRVDRASRYVAGTAPGLVVEVAPVAGTPLGEAVAVTVSEAPSSVYLSQLRRLTGGCSSALEALNGREFAKSVQCSATTKPQLSEWLINRAGDELAGTLGVPDDGPADAAVRIRILADGVEVGAFSASYGKPTDFAVPVTGALRLGVEVTAVNMPERNSSSWYAVLGDARLLGSSTAIDALTDES
jgi:hypothetical protein